MTSQLTIQALIAIFIAIAESSEIKITFHLSLSFDQFTPAWKFKLRRSSGRFRSSSIYWLISYQGKIKNQLSRKNRILITCIARANGKEK